jgi:hypothetical protein
LFFTDNFSSFGIGFDIGFGIGFSIGIGIGFGVHPLSVLVSVVFWPNFLFEIMIDFLDISCFNLQRVLLNMSSQGIKVL